MAKIEEFDGQGDLVVDEPDPKDTELEEGAEHQEASQEERHEDDPADPKETDTETIREMRARFKELRQEKIRLQNENNELKSRGGGKQEELKEPTMEDVGFDAKKYRDAMLEYAKKVAEQEKRQTDAQKEQEEINASWQASLRDYNLGKAKIEGFEEAELAVDSTLSPVQKGIIVSAANDAAKMMFEIGNDDKLLSELAKIKDLTKFSAKIGELNARTRRTVVVPKPESRINAPSAAVGMAGGPDKKLEALRKEADETGDYTKVNAYKRALAKGGK